MTKLAPFRIALAALALSAAPALETSLTLTQSGGGGAAGGGTTITIDPGMGTISLYLVQDGKLNKRPSSANFLTDLHFLAKNIVRNDKDRGAISALELGSTNNDPSVDALIQQFAAFPKPKAVAGAEAPLPLVQRARNTEDDFWGKLTEKDEPYDGVISAALGPRFLYIAVPSCHTLMVYEIQGEQILQRAWRNFGPELFVPQVFKSEPSPQKILDSLPKDVREAHLDSLKQQMESIGQGAAKTIPLQPCDLWVAAGPQDRAVLVDFANKHIMTYQFTGQNLQLSSIRNMEIDLLIPSAFESTPDPQQLFTEFANDKVRKQFLAEQGILNQGGLPDLNELKALVGMKQVKGGQKVSPIQATANPNQSFDITIDFTQMQKILCYRVVGLGNGLQFTSMRDYTLDSALAALDNMRLEKVYGAQLLASAKTALSNHNDDMAWIDAREAMKLDPNLHVAVEKDASMVKTFSKQKDYEAVIKAATDAAKREADAIAERKKKAQEMRDAKKKKTDDKAKPPAQ